jgi:hypothetical protein
MGAVSIMPRRGDWTYADLEQLPDDGLRYELIDGNLLVTRTADLTDLNLPGPPRAIEVLSPSTKLIDLNLKRARLELAGCPSYWVVDPDGPRLRAWELRGGAYVEVADVSGEETWTSSQPFALTICPADLIS